MESATVFSSAARTASENSSDQVNSSWRGVRLFLHISASSGTTPTLDLKIQVKDPVSSQYIDLPGGSFAQKTGTGTDELTVFPGIAAVANRAVSQCLGRTWRVVATIGGTTPSFTFSVAAQYLP